MIESFRRKLEERTAEEVLAVLLLLALVAATSNVLDAGNPEDAEAAAFRFDEGAGETAYDTSNSSFEGSVNDANWTEGVRGSALEFDGSSSYVDTGINGDYNTDSFTVSAWIRADDVSSTGQRIVLDDANINGYALSLGDPGSGAVRFYIRGKDTVSLDTPTGTVGNGKWYHVVGVYDSSTNDRYIYVNGREEASLGSDTGSASTDSGTVKIGGEPANSNFFDGRIDDVRIFEAALNRSQVSSLYRGGSYSSGREDNGTSGKVLDIGFRKRNSTYVLDTSGENNHGEPQGDTSQVGAVNCKVGRCYSFGGSSDAVFLGKPESLKFSDEAFTVMAWAKFEGGGSTFGRVVNADSGGGTGSTHGYRLYIDSGSNNWRFTYSNSTNYVEPKVSELKEGVWQHVAGVYNGTHGKIYVNGVKGDERYSSGTIDPDWSQVDNIEIGNRDTTNNFDGKIDQVKVFDRALDQSQIIEEARRLESSGAAADLRFDDGGGDLVYDHSGNENRGQLQPNESGGPSRTGGLDGGALNFDSENDEVNISHDESISFNDSFTVNFWIKGNLSESGASFPGVVYKTRNYRFWGRTGGTPDFGWRIDDNNGDDVRQFAIDQAAFPEWTMVTGTFDRKANEMKLYKNTELKGTRGVSSLEDITSTGDLYLGSRDGQDYANITMDRLKLFPYAISESKLEKLYAAGSTSFENDSTDSGQEKKEDLVLEQDFDRVENCENNGTLSCPPQFQGSDLPDLIVDGGTDSLSEGSYEYKNVIVKNGGRLDISGKVSINATNFTIFPGSEVNGYGGACSGGNTGEPGYGPDSSGTCILNGSGAGQNNTDDAGGGGGYGGQGSNAPDSTGGSQTYGSSSSQQIRKGSGGGGGSGSSSDVGGAGGAALKVVADDIGVEGEINVSGEKGNDADTRPGGGGSGGGVLLEGSAVEFTGSIYANGGDGGIEGSCNDCGGGGGGGRIKVFYGSSFNNAGTMQVNGGVAEDTTYNGDPGTTYDTSTSYSSPVNIEKSKIAVDGSGEAKHGALEGDSEQIAADSCVIGRCLSKTTGKVNVSEDESLDVKEGFTVGAWINVNDISSDNQAIVTKGKYDGGYVDTAWQFKFQNNDEINFQVSNDGTSTTGTVATRVIDEKEWEFVVGRYNTTHINVFVNGEQKSSTSYSSGVHDSNLGVSIGSLQGVDNFNGKIDEAFVYNRSLSDKEIWSLYTRGRDRQGRNEMPGPEAWYRQSDRGFLYDYSGQGNSADSHVVGETGTFNTSDGEWKEVRFEQLYEDPVVVGTANTQNGEPGLVFEARNVGNGSAEMRLCESEGNTTAGCDTHGTERAGYMVIDAKGANKSSGLEAGKEPVAGEIDSTQANVSFGENFGSKPIVFFSTQNSSGGRPVEVWPYNTPTTEYVGFGICHQNSTRGEDQCALGHPTQQVGWVALQPGSLPFAEPSETGSLGSFGSSQWRRAGFSSGFSSEPVTLFEVQDNDGGQDSKIDEAKNITTSEAYVRFCEIDGPDSCDGHATMEYGYAALSEGVLTVPTSSGNWPHWRGDCVVGGCYNFDGSDDFVNITGFSTPSDSEFTFAAWINQSDGSSYQRAVYNGKSGQAHGFTPDNNGKMRFAVNDGSFQTVGTSASIDEWAHYTGVFDSGEMILYKNGDRVASKTVGSTVNVYDGFSVGADPDGSSAFEGSIDDVRLYPFALTGQQVNRIYREGTAAVG